MPPKGSRVGKGKASSSSSSLVAHNFLPTLTKPAAVIGDFISIQGRDWQGCPASDKEKWFRCVVRKFDALHDFGAFKSAGFEVQEMGESGEGSLEPGVASGDVFWVAYQQPFLKHYYKANPEKLPDGHPEKPKPQTAGVPGGDVPTPGTVVALRTAETASPAVGNSMPEVKQDAPVYGLFHLESDELCGKPGANFGKRQQSWTCQVKTPEEPCCAKRTLTFDRPGKVPPNSNLIGHIREEAKRCGYHAAALKQIDESSKFQALMPNGEYAAVHTFEEAFDHHVDFVMMVAAGEVSANTAKKPLFRTYVTGVCANVKGTLTIH
jgi:hypothetical protein